MKRMICLMCCLSVLLTSCALVRTDEKLAPVQPVEFFYCSDNHVYDNENGVLHSETRDLGAEEWSAEEILLLYLKGPQSEGLCSPFPDELKVLNTEFREETFIITFNDELSKLAGIDLTVAAACIVQTMTQLQGIEDVEIWSSDSMLTNLTSVGLDEDKFLKEDDSATSDHVTVRLYFADADNRYLVEETRSRAFAEGESIPKYIVGQLLAGPEERGSYVAIPNGVSMISVQVRNGVCILNLSSTFMQRLPVDHAQARMVIFSIVNSLTELPEIECVRILCAGSTIDSYAGIGLNRYLYREELAFGHTTASASMDGAIYVPCGSDGLLAEVPMHIRRSSGRSIYADVLSALLSFEPANGYENPVPDGTAIVDLQLQNRVCQVVFNSVFAQCDANPKQAEQAVRSVTATLCKLENVDAVQISVQDATIASVDLSQTFKMDKDWLLP